MNYEIESFLDSFPGIHVTKDSSGLTVFKHGNILFGLTKNFDGPYRYNSSVATLELVKSLVK